METFEIELEICLGYTHCGGMYTGGYGTVELTDEEVDELVKLMKEKNSSDVEEIKLREVAPEIYRKLDDAYRQLAYKTEEEYWLEEGYGNYECHTYDVSDMIEYLKEKDAWNFEIDENEFKDEEGNLDEEALECAERDYLSEAMDDYLYSLHGEERYDFLRNQVGISVDVDECEYEISIPSEIIDKAFPKSGK